METTKAKPVSLAGKKTTTKIAVTPTISLTRKTVEDGLIRGSSAEIMIVETTITTSK